MRIIHIFGARPQFIKVAMLARAWQGNCEQFFLHTGQHYDVDLSDALIADLNMPTPDLNLGVGSASPAVQTAQMMMGIEEFMIHKNPDCVFVYGDTNSTLAAALVASKMKTTLAHVEAGLRSFNRSMPEEINRIVTDHLSDYLFCPTRTALINLENEGIRKEVALCGDVMADALAYYRQNTMDEEIVLNKYDLRKNDFILLTLHRPGNVDSKENLKEIMAAVEEIGKMIVFPIHPRTKKMLQTFQIKLPTNVKAIAPLEYTEMIILEQAAQCVMTDSGGIQKEAYLMGTPCITLREETEWVETVAAGWNVLVGASRERILSAFNDFHPTGEQPALFGDFHAAEKIVEQTLEWMRGMD